jgi:transposase InsO family protein
MSWSVPGLQGVRAEFVMIAREVEASMRAACRQYGISRKTGYKWLGRYERQWLDGLTDRSRRPRSSPLQLSGEVVVALVGLHVDHEAWGPKKLLARLRRVGVGPDRLPSLATAARLSRRLGWTESRGRGRPAATVADGSARLERWRQTYNQERPHEALGVKTPGEVYRCSGRRLGKARPYG